MGLFPGSEDRRGGVVYGALPTHGRTKVAVVYHTTETRGVPGFRSGATAPHYLYHPVEDRWIRYAEYEDGYVGTLKGHRTGGHGNCKAFQVEIVAYSDRDASAGGIWVGDFTDQHYAELTRFWLWARDRYNIDDQVTPTPDGGWRYGTGSPYRMSDDRWESFSGLTAHGAVPRNSHWDTGVLDLERVAATNTTGEDMYPIGPDFGNSNEDVAYIQQSLKRLGFDPGRTDGVYDDGTKQALRQFRMSVGESAGDGVTWGYDGMLITVGLGALGSGGDLSGVSRKGHRHGLTGETGPDV